MRILLAFFCLTLLACEKEEISPEKSGEQYGQVYFWNPYPISQIGSGIYISVDGTLLVYYKASGITNGYFVPKLTGVHSYRYQVVDGTPNYHYQDLVNVTYNHNDTIKMINYGLHSSTN